MQRKDKAEGASGKPTVVIPYKDAPNVKQELMLLAAHEGHGKIMWVVREAVADYLKKHRKKLAKTG